MMTSQLRVHAQSGGDQPLVALTFHQVLKYKMQNTDPFGIRAVVSLWISGG